MLARVTAFTIDGLEPRRVTVEIDVRAGLPNFTIVGLADRAVRESRERVRGAILNSGFEFPQRRVTVNLAPASLRKAGPGFDLHVVTYTPKSAELTAGMVCFDVKGLKAKETVGRLLNKKIIASTTPYAVGSATRYAN